MRKESEAETASNIGGEIDCSGVVMNGSHSKSSMGSCAIKTSEAVLSLVSNTALISGDDGDDGDDTCIDEEDDCSIDVGGGRLASKSKEIVVQSRFTERFKKLSTVLKKRE